MTHIELAQRLQETGLPIAYRKFNKPPSPPYLTYLFAYASDIKADNQNYVPISNFQVELYTKEKDLDIENLVEDKLRTISPYGKHEEYLESEKFYQVVYTVQII